MIFLQRIVCFFIFLSSNCLASNLSRLVEPVVPLGHTEAIYAAAFSKNGKLAFSLSNDQSLRVWEVASGREVKKYKMTSDHVRALAVSPNGYWVVTGDENKGLKLWDVATGKKIQRFKGHHRQVNSLDFSPNGKILLSAGNDRTIKLWDIKTSQLLAELRGHRKKINQAIFSHNGKYIASASDDKSIIIFDVKTGKKVISLIGHKKAVLSIDFSSDDKYLISAGLDKQIILWELNLKKHKKSSAKKIKSYQGHTKAINSVVFSADGKSILSASDDNTIRSWDRYTAKQLLVFKGHSDKVLDIAYSANGKFVLSASKDQTLRLWGADKANQIRIFSGQASRLNAIAITPNGKYLFSAHNDRTLKLWDLKTGAAIKIFNRHNQRINDIAIDPMGKYAASASSDKQILVWNIEDGKRFRRFRGHKASVKQLLFTPSGDKILSASADKTIRLWDIKSYRQEKIFTGHKRAVIAIAIAPNGHFFVSSSKDKTIRLWNMSSGKSKIIAKLDYPVKQIRYSPDGQQIIISGWKLLKLDSQTGKQLAVFGDAKQQHKADIMALALANKSDLLASGSYDNQIKIWNRNSGELLTQFSTPQGGILSLAFTADNRRLISAGGDGVIRIWDLERKQEILRLIGSKDGEWISMTVDGYYDHSPEGSKLIHWVSKQGTNSYSFEQFESQFRRPDIIQARLAGRYEQGTPPPDMGKPPRIDFAEHLQSKQVKQNYINLKLKLIDENEIKTLRIYVNGTSVLEQQINQKEKKVRVKVPLFAGANQITALSYNQAGLSSDPRYLSVLSKQSNQKKPNLYILSIGISNYKNLDKTAQLNYAHSDARNFSTRFIDYFSPLYGKINNAYLGNDQAYHQQILDKLDQLANEINKNDVFMLFFAGHGYRKPNQKGQQTFYLASYDTIANDINRTSIDWQQLSNKLHRIKGRIMVFLDACHSASISNQTIVPNNELAEQLFNEKQGGIMVFSAAKGRQFAAESASYGSGEGLFSYAISKVLSEQGINADNNGNGYIEFSEMVEHVQQFVDQQSDGQQTPWLSHKELFGDLPIAKIATGEQ